MSNFSPDLHEANIRRKTARSLDRFQRAQQSLPGGISSFVRRAARPYPLYFDRGCGCHALDVDGNSYIDYGLAWGPLILGHAPPAVIEAVQSHLARGMTFGAQHDLEFEVGEMLTSLIPCAGLVCYANSGTEIVQIALRLARAVTGRSHYLKFEGHYHGWDDSVLVSYKPPRDAPLGIPVPVGMGQRPSSGAIIAQWNDVASVQRAMEQHQQEISAIICEPLLCNSGCIPPEPGFLEFLRDITRQTGALLIFDEVITGFRLDLHGAQGYYGVTPDLATYAKAVGGGAPLSVLAGKREYMNWIGDGRVVHAGSLNGNPIALAAAKATLQVLSVDGVYPLLWKRGERLRSGLEAILRETGAHVVTSGAGPVFQVSFMPRPARNYRDTLDADSRKYSDFALALLDEGVLVLPDGRWYVSTAHNDDDIEATLAAARRAAQA